MDRNIPAAGDTWTVRLGSEPTGPDVQVVMFFCATTGQRPYRVVEVPKAELEGAEAFANLGEADLQTLFEASQSMGFPPQFPTY
jgi:hypothetical protein